MNPIDMRGPEFLQFYLIYGLAALAGFRILRTLWMHTRLPSTSTRWSPGTYPREGDDYPIAFLRGGKQEVDEAVPWPAGRGRPPQPRRQDPPARPLSARRPPVDLLKR